VSDHRGLSLPFAARVLGLNPAAMDDPYKVVAPGAEGWLVRAGPCIL